MSGYIVETVKKPQYESVEQYRALMKKKANHYKQRNKVIENDGSCACCGQAFPMLAGALLKVQDATPTTLELQESKGSQITLCADCYTYGVRPKCTRFGNIKWNREGRKIKKRAEERMGDPW